MAAFVEAINKKTGDVQRIPAHWLTHPVLGQDFETAAAAPSKVAAQPTKKEKK